MDQIQGISSNGRMVHMSSYPWVEAEGPWGTLEAENPALNKQVTPQSANSYEMPQSIAW